VFDRPTRPGLVQKYQRSLHPPVGTLDGPTLVQKYEQIARTLPRRYQPIVFDTAEPVQKNEPHVGLADSAGHILTARRE